MRTVLGTHPLAQAEEKTQAKRVSFLRYLNAWWRYETIVRELSNFSDRELTDLGITRADIVYVAAESETPRIVGSIECADVHEVENGQPQRSR
jgi:uncharacterized protein YjiS (DUF1127 family)